MKRTRIDEERQVVRWMIELYCRKNHGVRTLCAECEELSSYCDASLDHCRFGEEKPTCKKCPVHCYKPDMREKIRQVMRFSGPRMIIYHPLAAIKHLMR